MRCWIDGRPSTWPSRPGVSRNADSATSAYADGSCERRAVEPATRRRGAPRAGYLTIETTVWSWVEPNSLLETRTVALPWPRSAPFGTVVLNEALPFGSVLLSLVIGPTPGMLRVNVTSAPASGLPSGSVTVAVSVIGSGSLERLIW